MKRFLSGLSIELNKLADSLNDAPVEDLMMYARELARIELRLQAARSLMEARKFEAEIDLHKKEKL